MESLLKQLPKVSDQRSPNEIYQSIVSKRKKTKIPNWLLPGLASCAVLVLVVILSPSLLNFRESVNDHPATEFNSSPDASKRLGVKEANTLDHQQEKSAENQINYDSFSGTENPTAVYSTDVEGHLALTYAIPDKNAQVTVPITVLIEKTTYKTWFEQFEETMLKLTEEEWGLADYFPLNADLRYDQASETVYIDVPADHRYGFGSTAETMFLDTLQDSFPIDKVKKVIFTTEGKKGIHLGDYGNIIEMELDSKSHNLAYFIYDPQNTDRPYLVPTEDSFSSLEGAFSEMEQDQTEHGLKASLPKGIHLDILNESENGETLELYISDEVKEQKDFLYSLEAIMLTAKSFGYSKLRVKTEGIKQVGPFSLDEEIPLPVAPNKEVIESN